MEITGTIVTGLGEGAFFMSMDYYKKEIKEKLGFDAYPGTLNVKIKNEISLGGLNPINIKGFESNGKKFGRIICYMAKLKNFKGAVIIPEFTRHDKKIIEFIAPVHLKQELSLRDGDEITLELK